MQDEELLIAARPHPLAMFGLMVFWLGVGLLGLIYIIYYKDITEGLQAKVKFEFIARHTYDFIWIASILAPLIVMAVFRINFGYVLVLLLLIVGRVLIWWKGKDWLGLPGEPYPHLENMMLIVVGAIGAIGVEVFRRGHRYYITSSRIVARFGMLRITERSTLYSKIDDLMLQKGVLGSIFNFGTVIPITSSGLGMGQDMAIAGAAAGAGKGAVGAGLFAVGGKAKNVPRELSIYVLYRIKWPEEARDLILEEMAAREGPRANSRYDDTEGDETGSESTL
jgi:membrane protein YdbS with pleckstrin-like domain